MPEALPTSFLSAMFWATTGASMVRLKWRASHDQLSVLWLMTVFGFGLVGAPILLNFGWAFGLGLGVLALIAPSIAYRFHFGGASPERSERWSVWLYATLLLAGATAVALNALAFVQDLRAVCGLPLTLAAALVVGPSVVVGVTGVFSAMGLKASRDMDV